MDVGDTPFLAMSCSRAAYALAQFFFKNAATRKNISVPREPDGPFSPNAGPEGSIVLEQTVTTGRSSVNAGFADPSDWRKKMREEAAFGRL